MVRMSSVSSILAQSVSIMSRAFFEACPVLAKLPRYKPVHPYCVVGNGQRVRVLFTIPVVISLDVHQFENFHPGQ